MPSTRAQTAREQADLNKAIQDSEIAFAEQAEQQLSDELATTVDKDGPVPQQTTANIASIQPISDTEIAASTNIEHPNQESGLTASTSIRQLDQKTISIIEDAPDMIPGEVAPSSSDPGESEDSETDISVTAKSNGTAKSTTETAIQGTLTQKPDKLYVASAGLKSDKNTLNHSDDNESPHAVLAEENELPATALIADTQNLSIVKSDSHVTNVDVVGKPASLAKGTRLGDDQGVLSHPPVSSRTGKENKTSAAVSSSKNCASDNKSALTRLAKPTQSGSESSRRAKAAHRSPGEKISWGDIQQVIAPAAVSSHPSVAKKTVVTAANEKIAGDHVLLTQDNAEDAQATVSTPLEVPAQPSVGKKNAIVLPAKVPRTRHTGGSTGAAQGNVAQTTTVTKGVETTTAAKLKVTSKFRLWLLVPSPDS